MRAFIEFVNNNPWRTGAIIVGFLLLVCLLSNETFIDRFVQGPDPTVTLTFYYKPNCPSCDAVKYHWAVVVKNLKTDGKIRTRAVNCDDPQYASECNRWSGHPVIVKQQVSGRERRFNGNFTYQNIYDFANRDY